MNKKELINIILDMSDEQLSDISNYIVKAQEGIKMETPKINTLDDFINQKIKTRTEDAIKKATTRKTGYAFKNPSWSNCIATATDNYGVPIALRNKEFMENPNKWGFEEIQFGDNVDSLPDGTLILDFNKEKDSNTPGHTIMLVGRTETGAPIYSYSSGKSTPEDMHNQTTNYSFRRWDDKIKPKAYRYIGTPEERKLWEREYQLTYGSLPSKQEGGTLAINGYNINYEEVNMEDFFNEENNN